jgi:hypothetical protein
LGQAVAAGGVVDERSRREGEDLLAECEQLRHDVDALGDVGGADAMRASLADSMLDARYAVERKAMSIRLARVAGQGEPPPDLRP